MASPFPGMNPYIENPAVWHDFHERFIIAASDALSPQLLPRYIPRIDEQIYVHELGEDRRRLVGRSDVSVAALKPGAGSAASALLDAPAEVEAPEIDIEGMSYLEIRDRASRELVTVIELLSPTNKNPGPDREQYIAKARNVLRSSANLVEIDLLRGGPPMPWRHLRDCDYRIVVSRYGQRPRAQFWPVGLRDRLPTIPIPLRPGDDDATLDLQSIVHHVYDLAGYCYYIYQNDTTPALSKANADWATQFVATVEK